MYNGSVYRGYYLDSETGWYFLNARYYSPEWRRFISPDDTACLDPENVNGLNLTKAIISGVTAYTFSYGSAELANLMLANGGDALLTWTAYGVSNFIFASHNFATDAILYHILN